MKPTILSAVAITALALSGCNGSGEDGGPEPSDDAGAANSLYKGIYLFPACDAEPNSGNTIGTVNIVLPNTFNGGAFNRSVNEGPVIPRNDKTIGQGWVKNKPSDSQPFDVILDPNAVGGKKYWLIRILLRPGQWRFLQDGNLSGVGLNSLDGTALCDSDPTIETDATGANQAKYIATFYVDVEKMAALGEDGEVPFTIAVTAGNLGANPVNTPVLIDPKIRNEGTGVRTSAEDMTADTQQVSEDSTEMAIE